MAAAAEAAERKQTEEAEAAKRKQTEEAEAQAAATKLAKQEEVHVLFCFYQHH